MKKQKIYLAILVILALCFLNSCASGGSASGKMNCSHGGEVCISMSTAPLFSKGSPVPLTITVNSTKDIPDLHVLLRIPAEATIDGPKTWENYLTASAMFPLSASWDFPIKAGQTLTFNRVLHFPSQQEGYFDILVAAVNTGGTIFAGDSFYIQITHNSGNIIRAGTPFLPYTPDVPDVTVEAYGPGTPLPTSPFVTIPTRIAPLVATSTLLTPLTSPYPPPSTPSISPSPSTTPPPYP